MKITTSLTLCLFSLGAVAAARAQQPIQFNPPPDGAPAANAAPVATPPGDTLLAAPASAPAPAFTDVQLAEEVGWLVAKKVGVADLQFNQTEIEAILKGFASAVNGKDSPYNMDKISPEVDAFMQTKQTAYLDKLKQQDSAASTDFFAKLKDDKNVTALPSGLYYEILKPGDGPYPKANETVKVHYTGTLIDGTVFDSSVQRGQPVEFALDQVIPGWTEGIQKINKGGKIKLYIPANLAYGDEGRPGIPPASTLIFEVELLDIKPAGSAPATPPPTPQ